MVITSWNVNSIRARLEHVTRWLAERNPDILLLQELKAAESRSPIEVVSTTLIGDEADSHTRFLEADQQHSRCQYLRAEWEPARQR